MIKYYAKKHPFVNKITTFALMVTLTVGKAKGRAAIDSTLENLHLLDKGIKVGFKIFLYLTTLLTLYLVKQWMFS